MLETSARLLRLLSLLQTRRDWTGAELAERLGVTTRTVRSDVDRLRELGYPVARHARASPAATGSAPAPRCRRCCSTTTRRSRSRSGCAPPPAAAVAGIEETSLRALAKLEQVLPVRLRHRVNALQARTVAVPGAGPTVDADVLTAIAAACRDHRAAAVRLPRRTTAPTASGDVEPHRLVHRGRRWYLVAWDVDRGDWRTFRVDRLSPRTPTGPRFTPRDPPGGDVAAYVSRVGTATWRYRAKVLLHAPAEACAGQAAAGVGDRAGRRAHLRRPSARHPAHARAVPRLLDVDFEVTDAPGTGRGVPPAGRALRPRRGGADGAGTRHPGGD